MVGRVGGGARGSPIRRRGSEAARSLSSNVLTVNARQDAAPEGSERAWEGVGDVCGWWWQARRDWVEDELSALCYGERRSGKGHHRLCSARFAVKENRKMRRWRLGRSPARTRNQLARPAARPRLLRDAKTDACLPARAVAPWRGHLTSTEVRRTTWSRVLSRAHAHGPVALTAYGRRP
jgi:hypothetical protein